LATDINKMPAKSLAAYPKGWDDINFNLNNRNATNRYGNEYQTGTVGGDYDLGRFDDILKRKGTKSRYAADKPQTYGSIAQYQQTNKDAAFMRKYKDLEWSDTYQIGRKRRERSAADIQEDKNHSLNMLEAIQNDPQIEKSNPLVQNLIGAIQRRYQHPPRTEDNYDWRLWGLLFQVLAGGRHHFPYNPKHSTYNSTMYDIG
jgi:hypothetical protein